jgi:hypothetical protein
MGASFGSWVEGSVSLRAGCSLRTIGGEHPSALLLECVQAPPKRRILLLGAMNEGGVGARNRGRIVRLPPVRLRSAIGTQHAAI